MTLSFKAFSIFIVSSLIVYRSHEFIKNRNLKVVKEVKITLFTLYILILLFVTLFKFPYLEFINPFDTYMYKIEGLRGLINIIPFKETIETLSDNSIPIMNPIRNIVGNILIFTPLGFLIPTIKPNLNKIVKVTLIGFFVSLSIEVLQIFTMGNVCDIDDVILNTIGSFIGIVIYKIFIKFKKLKLY